MKSSSVIRKALQSRSPPRTKHNGIRRTYVAVPIHRTCHLCNLHHWTGQVGDGGSGAAPPRQSSRLCRSDEADLLPGTASAARRGHSSVLESGMLQTNKTIRTQALEAPPAGEEPDGARLGRRHRGADQAAAGRLGRRSQEEYDRLCAEMVDAGTLRRLEPGEASRLLPGLLRSERRRARRRPHLHLLASTKEDAGPTNNWMAPGRDARARCDGLFDGCMRGRTMYVVPFSMGPLGSPDRAHRRRAVRLPYVAVNMRIMTRMGKAVFDVLGADGEFVPCVHTVGAPLAAGPEGRAVAVQQDQVHRPLSRDARDLVATAPATAATRCWARSASRCASPRMRMGRDGKGWLAEHMLILGVDHRPKARSTTSPRRSRPPAARPTSRC